MKLITLFCAVSLLTACQGRPNHNFTVNGNIKNWHDSINLFKIEAKENIGRLFLDKSSVDKSGNFIFNINANDENIYILQWGPTDETCVMFINDHSNITIKGNAEDKTSFTIKNSPASNIFLEILKYINDEHRALYQLQHKRDSLNTYATNTNHRMGNIYNPQITKLQIRTKNRLLQYYNTTENPTLQYIVLSIVLNFKGISLEEETVINLDEKEIKELINQSVKKYPANKYIQQLPKELAKIEAYTKRLNPSAIVATTQKLPSFSLPNTEGKTVNIDEFKGKYFLLDFWASWCGPCRQENPYLVKAFNRFKNKNFTIVGVSLDDNKDAWLNAITKDNLTWTHLSDLKGWESQAAQSFHINSIPFNLLVDPQGNIIASELRGEMLEQKLEEILK